jgi:hypothetical protein
MAEKLIEDFISTSLKQDDIQFKDAEKMSDYTNSVNQLALAIYQSKLIEEFSGLLKHENPQVVINAAHYLLTFKEAEAKAALNQILSTGDRPYNYLAKFTLKQWEEGNAKQYQSQLFGLE